MNLSEFCIKRPVFASVLSLVLIVIGLMGFNYLDTRFLPKFEKNKLRISATYEGASAKLIETSITTPIEEAISGVQGIDTIESTSYQGFSQIKVTLNSGENVDEVANKIRNKVEDARGNLPDNIAAPTVETMGNDEDLLDIGFVNPKMDLNAVRDYLQRYVIDRISQIPGIAQVQVIGANEYAMRIQLDPQKMAARNITIADVSAAIQSNNIELPAGQIKSSTLDFPITTTTKLHTTQEFDNIVIKNNQGNFIRIKDIGYSVLGSKTSDESFVRINNQPAVLLSITNTEDSNPLNAAKMVNNYLNSIQSQLPDGMKIVRAYDQSIFMKDSVHEVYSAILIATLCVIVIIFLFLGQLRTVLVPILTIPICLMASFGIMFAFGFSINIITLLALVLSIGLVVDDAIVMLENIYRHIEEGEKPFIAAIKGSKEIAFAVIAMTLTLAAVYAPVGLIHGQIAAIFRPFAFTLAGAVIISGFVALTLSPMMCSRLLKSHSLSSNKYSQFLDIYFTRLAQHYQSLLNKILSKKRWVMALMGLIIVGGFFILRATPLTFMPPEDIGLIVASLNTPSGTNIHTLADQSKQVSQLFNQEPEVQSVVSIASTNAQAFNVNLSTLKPFSERKRNAQTIANQVEKNIKTTPGLNASAFPPSFGGSMHNQLEFSITNTGTYENVYQAAQTVIQRLKKQYTGLRDIQSSVKFDSQQYNITVNRDLAANLQVNVKDIDNTIATMLGGVKVSSVDIDDKSYDVFVQGTDPYLHNLTSLNSFYVNNRLGQLIPLSNLVQTQSILAETQLPHFNRLRSAVISAQLAPGYNLGAVVSDLQKILPEIMPNNTHFEFMGQAKDIVSSNSSMGSIFILALIFIYLVLSAQFESFWDPLIILLAVPFSVIGALLSLKWVGGSINIYTIVGLVTLIGLIAKHGILITQFANQLQEKGLSLNEALIKSATIRLRPILMTTAAMVFGALPLVFASGASAESRGQIGAVIVGGLLCGTFFSLILVPITYQVAGKIKLFFKNRRASKSLPHVRRGEG